ncbi:MAG: iron-containing alcohol dehydrogenase [Ruminococcaceae bacterium]|nr:iron-containing alcohol dehydrogenase [Oscillospiraceae bacterium]
MTEHMYIPTRLVIGRGCVKEYAKELSGFGAKALLVTGKSSAEKSGALADMKEALRKGGISWEIFNEVEANPTLETCVKGGQLAKKCGADFVIAIGGGSPMDAAKAIAVFATNEIAPMDIFKADFKTQPLPLICVPLTAGTGSEVTPYSILTVHEIKNKQSFAHPANFSRLAFLDPEYLKSMTRETLLDTVADALSHAIESILCKRSTKVSEVYAEAALRRLSSVIPGVIAGKPDYEMLLLASSLAGMAISHTGTVIVHSMGYMLTYYKDVPHGRANALLLPGFIRLCEKHVPDALQKVLDATGKENAEALCDMVKGLTAQPCSLSFDEAAEFASKAIKAKNVSQNLWALTEAEEADIFAAL